MSYPRPTFKNPIKTLLPCCLWHRSQDTKSSWQKGNFFHQVNEFYNSSTRIYSDLTIFASYLDFLPQTAVKGRVLSCIISKESIKKVPKKVHQLRKFTWVWLGKCHIPASILAQRWKQIATIISPNNLGQSIQEWTK